MALLVSSAGPSFGDRFDAQIMRSPLEAQLLFVQDRIRLMMRVQGATRPRDLVAAPRFAALL
ncbi:MAG: hypothetical protein WBG53_07265 [Rhodococcus sp. (in: high G+C Gram-positive bacteria)]